MAVIGNTVLTLADIAKSLDPNGMVATAINLLTQTNEILDDIPWMEGNLPTGHRTTLVTSLPTPDWRRINRGVRKSKSGTAQIDEVCARMEAFSDVDEALLEISPNPALTRVNEDQRFREAFNQALSETLFYGNMNVEPERFNGFATRFSSGAAAVGYADSMVNGGGSGSDNASIWVVGWGADTVHGIYPKGTQAGFQANDKGSRIKDEMDDDGTERERVVFTTQFIWQCGLAVRDWRHVVRIANIDYSNLVSETGAADLVKLLIRALDRIPSGSRKVIYVPRGLRTMWRIQMLGKSNVNFTWDNLAGREVLRFDGIPVRTVDQLLTTEAAVSFA